MRPATRWAVIGVVIAAALVIILLKAQQKSENPNPALAADTTAARADSACCADGDSSKCCPSGSPACATEAEMAADNASALSSVKPAALPRFLELGSIGCKACTDMAPIVEEMKKEYAGRMSVEFYDVRKDPAQAEKYGIKLIPTQIFLNNQGKEIFRHEGFLPKADFPPILAKMGVK